MATIHTVSVPFTGFVEVDVEFDGEPTTSQMLDRSTPFEEAALEAASAVELEVSRSTQDLVPHYEYEFHRRISSGNVLFAASNQMEIIDTRVED